jgi:hypothetical protein
LPNIGKFSHFVFDVKFLDRIFAKIVPVSVRVVGGLWVRLGKIKCGVFESACVVAKHLF